MAGFVEVAAVAFAAQLAVLPGEKVQFIIAGLSTRYDPKVVVAAAGTAFAGWTALEIWFGAALKGALPTVVLDGITVVLFVLFAVLLVRSAPEPGETSVGPDGSESAESAAFDASAETDGGFVDVTPPTVFGRDLDAFGSFVPIFTMMAVGEFGDKTQLVTIGLAVQYGAHPGIWAGEMLAIVPVSLANAYVFHRFSHRFDVRKAHLFGAALFGFFAADTVLAMATGFSVWETVVSAAADAILALV
ncbi:TMEM165/GDT1 family protein [Salinigranum salinum]|uniref:TMEM165/GDT1 family protein n=1 Tax=Salinigranum salinum TaxID=1364937 RepID=UPI001260E517|nr:TMEM165/GDT1 family protein [Salinigranum salinum]